MTSTIVATRDFALPRDIHHTHNSSAAPLPLIPRRPSSAPTSRRVSPLATPFTDGPSTVFYTRASPSHSPPQTPTSSSLTSVVVHPPTPPGDTAASSYASVMTGEGSSTSASGSDGNGIQMATRPRRIRGQRFPAMRPPERSTPIPSSTQTPVESDSDSDTPRPARSARTAASHSREPAITRAPMGSGAGKLRINVDAVRHMSESHVHTLAAAENRVAAVAAAAAAMEVPSSAIPSSASSESSLLRKKSGEPLKSSLKVKRGGVRGSLTIVTDPKVPAATSKSAPATPSIKNVHFDAHLEHVKFFLAEQKPLAVSRDGSPTDTSGTDSEFPTFIYGKEEGDKDRVLVMHKIAGPRELDASADCALERLELAPDVPAVNGVVRVRNIAFEKWVAVRFTMDFWQTTSEVTARYVDSVDDGKCDRFAFVIKLHDVLARAEEKMLFLAVRYTVSGREIWDSNNDANYQVKIVREKVQPKEEVKKAVEAPKKFGGNSSGGSGSEIEDLRNKLEEVVKGRASGTVGSLLAQHTRHSWGTSSPRTSPPESKPPSFRSESSLSSRYDFAESLRHPWHAPPSPQHTRTNTYPSSTPNSIPWPQRSSPIDTKATPAATPYRGTRPYAPQGSPRDTFAMDYPATSYFPTDSDMDTDDAITLVPSLRRGGNRNHQRGGFFDARAAQDAGVKRTPPASSFESQIIPRISLPANTAPPAFVAAVATSQQNTPMMAPFARFNSFPPADSPNPNSKSSPRAYCTSPMISQHWATALRQGGSEESTPSITSPSSESSSRSASPSLDDGEVPGMPPSIVGGEQRDSPINHLSDYHILLNRFCFYTGPDSFSEPSDNIPRSHSASSIEEFLSAGQSPPLGGFAYHSPSPFSTPMQMRSPAAASDDELQRSGSTTPTGFYKSHALPQTPPLRA